MLPREAKEVSQPVLSPEAKEMRQPMLLPEAKEVRQPMLPPRAMSESVTGRSRSLGRCTWPMLPPKAIWIFLVWDAAWGHVDG